MVTRLEVSLIGGRLNVVATDGPARVEITRASSRPVITVEHHDGRLSVRQDWTRNWHRLFWWFGRRFRVDVSIAVPAHVLADLRLVDGSVIVSGLREDTSVNVTSGQVTLMGLAGRTSAKVVSGPVEALGVSGELTMETVSGELVLADGSATRVRATTISGAITCDLDNPRRSEIRLSTTSGSVTVRVRADSDLAVHLHTTSGRITSAFPQLKTSAMSWSKESHGRLGAGEGKLWANSTSGSIALLARPADADDDFADDDFADDERRETA
ncbi:DUF4097 domain-containing protein [Micromonospora sp. NBC_01699]|uniref:DUF4097 family beta strand repeat-containing protein n=1 Tax=Micromonospora sp. NBC_01699 TaxID=2975984 RepID=UPI002E2ABEFB|nr:DUF4097 family beta strand repeat-containing protein [Micromonospora sp. NBC_01699]